MKQNVIILIKGDSYEVWGSLTRLCEAHQELSYNYLKRLEFPFENNGYTFIKTKLRR